MNRKQEGFTLIELLIVVAIIGIIAAIAIPNLLNAIDRGKQKRSMADLRSVGTAVEEYAIDNSFYPNVAAEANIAGSAVETSIEPVYIRNAPTEDGWGFNMRYISDTTVYTVGSLAKDGAAGGNLTINSTNGRTTDFDCDIIFSNGSFVQWPEGTQAD
ncbi:MAG: prepilin-type N-terminal cleavage/methylation domain-containing protein [Acidobacteriota bacterium]